MASLVPTSDFRCRLLGDSDISPSLPDMTCPPSLPDMTCPPSLPDMTCPPSGSGESFRRRPGADQLYAKILRQNHISYSVVIPCAGYEKTFLDAHDLEQYQTLLDAVTAITLPFDEPSETAFYAAGKKVVDLSDMMIAVWNGLPAKGLGGTADIVSYSLLLKKRILHLNPIDKTISLL